MDRPTREFKTTNGHNVTMYDYVTGSEARAIKAVHQKPSTEGKATEDAAHDYALKTLVLSLDGNSEDLVNRILDLPLQDFAEITAALTELLDPKKK